MLRNWGKLQGFFWGGRIDVIVWKHSPLPSLTVSAEKSQAERNSLRKLVERYWPKPELHRFASPVLSYDSCSERNCNLSV